jgi:DNA-binding SARP family transcriptional activator
MGCYLKMGELAEAARTYSRCREALARGLAMQPSMETERLYLEGVRGGAERGAARHPNLPFGVVRNSAMRDPFFVPTQITVQPTV